MSKSEDSTDVEPDSDNASSQAESDDNDAQAPAASSRAEYKPTQWVIVQYAGKRSVSYFLGQVLEVVSDGIRIKFLKRQAGSDNLFTFPEKEDIDVVPREDIVDSLKQQPDMNNRQQFLMNYQKYHLS